MPNGRCAPGSPSSTRWRASTPSRAALKGARRHRDRAGGGRRSDRRRRGAGARLSSARRRTSRRDCRRWREPDSVVIAAGTRRLVGDLFEYAISAASSSKGSPAGAGLAGAAARARRKPVRGARGAAEHCRGRREEELELLLRRWQQAKGGKGRVVLLSGEPGIGKSRLHSGIAAAARPRGTTPASHYSVPPTTRTVRSTPSSPNSARAGSIRARRSGRAEVKKLEAILESAGPRRSRTLPSSPICCPFSTGDTVARPHLTPQQRKERTLGGCSRRLVALARAQPVLIVVEDVIGSTQDPRTARSHSRAYSRSSGAAADHLSAGVPAPLARPAPTSPPCHRAGSTGRRRRLWSARWPAGNALADELMRDRRAYGRCPLFVEELTKAVLEAGRPRGTLRQCHRRACRCRRHCTFLSWRGSTARAGGQMRPRSGPPSAGNSPTRCSPRESGFQTANSQRRSNSWSALVWCSDAEADLTGYLFKHALVRDAAYGTLLRSKLPATARSASPPALEAHLPQRSFESEPELAARHFSELGLPDRAVPYWSKAADRAARNYAVAEAIEKRVELALPI